MDIKSLIQQLREHGSRSGVGVWLMPREYLGREDDIALKLNIQSIDAREAFLEQLPRNARFSGLTRPDGHGSLMRLLRQLSKASHQRDCLLLHTLDLLLLGLEIDERERFWHSALGKMPYPCTKLVLAIPENTADLFPYALMRRYAAWVAEGKIA